MLLHHFQVLSSPGSVLDAPPKAWRDYSAEIILSHTYMGDDERERISRKLASIERVVHR